MSRPRRTVSYLATIALEQGVSIAEAPFVFTMGASWVDLSREVRLSAVAWRCLALAMARVTPGGYWYVENASSLAVLVCGTQSYVSRALQALEVCNILVQAERKGHWRKYMLNPLLLHRHQGKTRYMKRKEYERLRHARFGPVAEMWRAQQKDEA